VRGVYYNELDPYCCQWLRNLIAAGHLPDGEVDERSIREVSATDLRGFTACHFFAGIGGWPLALRLAGWPDDQQVWTGSCPCQPFSCAGKRGGTSDERHLWPEFHRLIGECAPPVVFGEQVTSKDGREWLAGVRADLEAMGYGVGAADLCAAGAGAPHIRQRLWWVAESESVRCGRRGVHNGGGAQGCGDEEAERGELWEPVEALGVDGRLGESDRMQPQQPARERPRPGEEEGWGACSEPARSGAAGFWSAHSLIPCLDGKTRRTQPGLFPLALGIPARVGKLRAYGNAIVPQVAAQFIGAFMEASCITRP